MAQGTGNGRHFVFIYLLILLFILGFNSEYVCVGTPEENVLETYFVMISRFNFDRAREQTVRVASHVTVTWCFVPYPL